MFAFAVALTVIAQAQEPAVPAAPPSRTVTPLKVQVVITRYKGDKKVSSLPYTLSMNAEGRGQGHASLRMGAKVPVVMMVMPEVDGKPLGVTAGPIQYQDLVTNIDCFTQALEDGRYQLTVAVEDSSVYPDEPAGPGALKGNPSFRSFKVSDSMVLKDAGTAQFTTATDKLSGEIVKVDVTLTVIK
jgi:hypothetical protein